MEKKTVLKLWLVFSMCGVGGLICAQSFVCVYTHTHMCVSWFCFPISFIFLNFILYQYWVMAFQPTVSFVEILCLTSSVRCEVVSDAGWEIRQPQSCFILSAPLTLLNVICNIVTLTAVKPWFTHFPTPDYQVSLPFL